MTRTDFSSRLADLVLMTHAGFVAFVIGGLFLIVLGGIRGWSWIRNPWFRWLHLAAIALVITQTWLGMICPLTQLEKHLRESAGETTYGNAFIVHWLERLLYFKAPPWVFAVCYTLFGVAVVGAWFKFWPRTFRDGRASKETKG